MSADRESEMGISVVVPVYNAEQYLARCIDALVGQTDVGQPYEIILVDNNSTDHSAEIARSYPDVRLLSETKQSSYAARNRGTAAAAGKIVAFTDADCVPDPSWLAVITTAMRAPQVRVVQGGRVYGSGAARMLSTYEAERAAYVLSQGSSEIAFGYTNNMAVRREVFERCGPFLEISRGADSLFVRRVMEEYGADSVAFVRDARIRHLEINGLRDFLHKKIIYGRSAYRNYDKPRLRHRDLTRQEGIEIFRQTVRRQGYSLPQTLWLAVLLNVATLCYQLGRKSARWRDQGRKTQPSCPASAP